MLQRDSLNIVPFSLLWIRKSDRIYKNRQKNENSLVWNWEAIYDKMLTVLKQLKNKEKKKGFLSAMDQECWKIMGKTF